MMRFADLVDRLNAAVGRAAAWLVLVAVLLQFGVVVARHVFGLGSVAVQETVLYAAGLAFLLAAGHVLREGGLVRVDVVYSRLAPRARAAVDLAGALALLLPFAAALLWLSLPYVARSWAVLEASREAGGLPIVFAFKTAIPVFAVLLALQGLAQAARAVAVLRRAAR